MHGTARGSSDIVVNARAGDHQRWPLRDYAQRTLMAYLRLDHPCGTQCRGLIRKLTWMPPIFRPWPVTATDHYSSCKYCIAGGFPAFLRLPGDPMER